MRFKEFFMSHKRPHDDADPHAQPPGSQAEPPRVGEVGVGDVASDARDEARSETRSAGDVIDALNAENAALKDKLLRALAESENMRRRAEKDLADARVYAVSNFAREMLGVADNLRRALDAMPAQAREAFPAMAEGVELTERDLLSRLSRFQVRKLEPQGQKFDPNFHEALFEIPDPTVPNGTVAQVVEDGFAIGERVLRPAKVGVSRGGPKA
jgi:molecular chaperone GrpE